MTRVDQLKVPAKKHIESHQPLQLREWDESNGKSRGKNSVTQWASLSLAHSFPKEGERSIQKAPTGTRRRRGTETECTRTVKKQHLSMANILERKTTGMEFPKGHDNHQVWMQEVQRPPRVKVKTHQKQSFDLRTALYSSSLLPVSSRNTKRDYRTLYTTNFTLHIYLQESLICKLDIVRDNKTYNHNSIL